MQYVSSIGNELLSIIELFSILNTLWSQGGRYTEVLLYCEGECNDKNNEVLILSTPVIVMTKAEWIENEH